jgi:uncharacterized protein (TIGR03067 family)
MLMETGRTSVALLLLLTGAGGAGDGDQAALQGTWSMQSQDALGKAKPAQMIQGLVLTIKGDRWTLTRDGKVSSELTAKLDPAKSPKAVDFTVVNAALGQPGEQFLAIYEVKGDTLRVCAAAVCKPRPAEFKTGPDPDKGGVLLSTYKREKKG